MAPVAAIALVTGIVIRMGFMLQCALQRIHMPGLLTLINPKNAQATVLQFAHLGPRLLLTSAAQSLTDAPVRLKVKVCSTRLSRRLRSLEEGLESWRTPFLPC